MAERARTRRAARGERRLRLFLVAPGVTPPVDWDGLSDWVRSPAEVGDVYAWIEALQRRNAAAATIETWITLDGDGILRRGKRWVALAPVEEPMIRVLLARPGAVVSRSELLASAGTSDSDVNATRVLDPRLRRLRHHIAPLGVSIMNVRRRGYLIKLDES